MLWCGRPPECSLIQKQRICIALYRCVEVGLKYFDQLCGSGMCPILRVLF